jgi:hypothetical protein
MRLDAADRVLDFVSSQQPAKHKLASPHHDARNPENHVGNENCPVTTTEDVAKR